MNTTAKANKAELDAWAELESHGYLVGTRRKGRREKGPGDHLAYHPANPVLLVEVKESKTGPYQDFPPAERAELADLARRYGCVALLMWRPAPSKPFRWIYQDGWPESRLLAA